MRLVVASSNQGKLVEIREVLAGLHVELVAQSEIGIGDADEVAGTFIENALLKARHAARLSGLPALGDDSGICVDALGGAPGLYSARYAGAHGDAAANIAKLLAALHDVPDSARSANFYCVVVLLRPPSTTRSAADCRRPLARAHPCARARAAASATIRCFSIRCSAAVPPSSMPRPRIA
jgi:XTP/dITP diphosphohydrolase